jgi:SAM-dependent methyltransferase
MCPACSGPSNEAADFGQSLLKDCSYPGFSYSRCANCASIFLADLVSEAELTDYHRRYWGVADNFSFKFAQDKSPRERSDAWFRSYAEVFGQGGNGAGPGARTLLDCGSGTGEFCAAASRYGFKAYGIDPSSESVRQAKEKFPECEYFTGIPDEIVRGTLRESGVPAVFDVITLHDVLEHVGEPAAFLRTIGGLLAPGGRLYVKVPSAEHLQFDYLAQYSWTFMAPFHRTLFTKAGLEAVCAAAGLEVGRYLPPAYCWGWTRGLSWKLGLQAEYEELRKLEAFRKLDFAVDDLLERISADLGRCSEFFCEVKHRAPPRQSSVRNDPV